MRVRVLGCSGGLGGGAKTSSFLLDDDILIDAGSGIDRLSVEDLARIDHVFLTHSHLDHICALPLLIDSVGHLRDKPVIVHALPETIAALKEHIFNWVIWPDFSEIPVYERPYLLFEPLAVGVSLQIGDRRVKPIAANHTVPAVGFQVSDWTGSLIYSGDTAPNDSFWHTVNAVRDLRCLIIETAFANREQSLARLAKHIYPSLLGRELAKLKLDIKIFITHLKPADREVTAQEIIEWAGRFKPQILHSDQIIDTSQL